MPPLWLGASFAWCRTRARARDRRCSDRRPNGAARRAEGCRRDRCRTRTRARSSRSPARTRSRGARPRPRRAPGRRSRYGFSRRWPSTRRCTRPRCSTTTSRDASPGGASTSVGSSKSPTLTSFSAAGAGAGAGWGGFAFGVPTRTTLHPEVRVAGDRAHVGVAPRAFEADDERLALAAFQHPRALASDREVVRQRPRLTTTNRTVPSGTLVRERRVAEVEHPHGHGRRCGGSGRRRRYSKQEQERETASHHRRIGDAADRPRGPPGTVSARL